MRPNVSVAVLMSAAAACGMGLASLAAGEPPAGGVDGETLTPPQYPEGSEVPRGLTEEERRWLARHPIVAETSLRGPNPAPDGPVYCPPEYAPMEGIMVAWEGTAAQLALLTTMVREITAGVPGGGAYGKVYVVVDNAAEQTTAASQLAAAGCDMSQVEFVVRATDSIWIRDYGPRYIYQGKVRAIVDHTYNRPRPLDDVLPLFFSGYKKHAVYSIPLVHGGGNYHLDGVNRSYCTMLIANENPTLTQEQIIGHWQNFQNLTTHIFPAFSTQVDATQHIDMWMQVCGDDKVVISDFISNGTAVQNLSTTICNDAAAFMEARGYTVTRVPARNISGVHYTYTNVVICNGLILVPQYSQATMQTHNAAALAAWQSAMPEHRIVGVNCDGIVSLAGVMHCIVMHVPAHLGPEGPAGGQAPTAYLRTLRGGEELLPGSTAQIRWLADDDAAVTSIDILLSTDGGETFSITIASGLAHAASPTFNWTVPDRFVRRGRIKIVAHDAVGNTGSDASEANIRILGGCDADWDASETVNSADISAFLATWLASLEAGDLEADYNADAMVNSADISAFLAAWIDQVTNGC